MALLSRVKPLPGALAFFTVVTAWMLLPQVTAPFSVFDLGDPLLSIWRLAWVAHQLPRDPMHLFDANIFHPHVRTLAYSDAMLLPAAVAAPLLWLGVHQVLVYNIILLASIVSSGVTMFLLVRALTDRPDAALVAGMLFAFCSFRFDHFGHLELQVTPWMPLGLFWFHRAIAAHRLRDGLLTGLAVALQGLSSLYYGIFFSTFLVCLTVIVTLALSVLAGFGVARIVGWIKRPLVQRTLVIGLALAALFEARPVLSLEPLWRQPPPVYAALPGDRASVLTEFPFPSSEEVFGRDFLFMYFSTFHWNRLVNGASGFLPADYLEFRKEMDGFPSDRAVSALRTRGVEFVVVHGKFYEAPAYARVIADLDRRSSLRLVTADQWEGSDVRLYRLEEGP